MSKISFEIEHSYPSQVHIIDQPYLTTLLTQASLTETKQPQLNHIINSIYSELFSVVISNEWPQQKISTPTRMTELHPEQILETSILRADQKAVCVDIARAGMLPAQLFFDRLNTIIDPSGNRLDHIFASRISGNDHQVTHTEINSSKVGGDIDQAMVFIPDPMGATGHSLCEVLDFYKNQAMGSPKKIISVHMIITPEFIRSVTTRHPDVIIYAARLDRGLSSPKALKKRPGELWDEEKGLNDRQYIVPGAGGVGELINNSFV